RLRRARASSDLRSACKNGSWLLSPKRSWPPKKNRLSLAMQAFESLDGALLVDKPPGLTSHDVVDQIRRRFRIRKVGHCGTLDPNATGLLVIVLGKATKLSEKLMACDKVYEGAAHFGVATHS